MMAGWRVARYDGDHWLVDADLEPDEFEGGCGPEGCRFQPFLLHGTAPDDLWVASARSLRHRDGEGWSTATGLPHGRGWGCRTPIFYGPTAMVGLGDGTAVVGTSSWPGRCGCLLDPICNPGLRLWDGAELVPYARAPEFQKTRGLWASGPSEIWAATDVGLLELSAGRWTTHPHPPDASLAHAGAFAGTSADDLWAAVGRRVFRWDGDSWHDESPPAEVFGHLDGNIDELMVLPDVVWAVGGGGLILELRR